MLLCQNGEFPWEFSSLTEDEVTCLTAKATWRKTIALPDVVQEKSLPNSLILFCINNYIFSGLKGKKREDLGV